MIEVKTGHSEVEVLANAIAKILQISDSKEKAKSAIIELLDECLQEDKDECET